MKLKGKITAITGAGRGIGQAAAALFASEGAQVVLLEIDEKAGVEAEQAIRASGGEAKFISVDITDEKSVANAFDAIETTFGRLDVLYNNASIFLGDQDAAVTELSSETWHRIIACNLNGLYYCCKYGIALLKKSGGGSVINTASSASISGIPGCDAYTASKGATVSLTRSMAVEYGPDNIRVNCIAPAGVVTPMIAESNLNNSAFDEKAFLARTPLRRWGKPEEIAKLAVFLASDDASYLNGTMVVADGAITITPFF